MTAESETHHHPRPTSPIEDRVAALEALLVEKGILDPEVIDDIVEHYEHELGSSCRLEVTLRADGPRFVEIRRTIELAARSGRFGSDESQQETRRW